MHNIIIPGPLCRGRNSCIEPVLQSVREHASCKQYAKRFCGSANTHKHNNYNNFHSQCTSFGLLSMVPYLVNAMQRAWVVDSHTLGSLNVLTDTGKVQWGTPLLQGQTRSNNRHNVIRLTSNITHNNQTFLLGVAQYKMWYSQSCMTIL